ncbi:cadherin-like domain-containing protein [Deinococcus humi]|uniref:Cadherin-like domain-containing protein n=1 Tax=Deinococcus humi TaxID=662880 RepID=A0A7W8NFM8_9DEIO|nr:hypothetical protein [Deinococcus humi]
MTPTPATPTPTPLPGDGLVEITFSDIGSEAMGSSAKTWVAPHLAGQGLQATSGNIQLEPVSRGSFTSGIRGSGGYRYLYATFKVRNAGTDGTPYATARSNLTFVAASTSGTLSESALRTFKKFDGTNADPSIAPTIVPTHGMLLNRLSGQPTLMPGGEDFQIFTEDEVDPSRFTTPTTPAALGVTKLFPYGFVVRNTSTPGSRSLPANPGVNQFDGTVTFAVKVPLQTTASEDPFTFSMMFRAVDDPVTRVTESVEEQGASTQVGTRAAALGAAQVAALCGSNYAGANLKFIPSVTLAGNTQRLSRLGGDFILRDTTVPTVSVVGNTSVNGTGLLTRVEARPVSDAPAPTLTVSAPASSAQGGDVTVTADGSYVFNPKAGATNVTDTLNYAVSDGTCITPAGTLQVPLAIGQRVWYVNNTNTTGTPDGRRSGPFSTLAAAQSASSDGDIIYVYRGDGTSTGQNAGITLKTNQKLIGQGVPLTVSGTSIEAAGQAPVIGHTAGAAITVAANNALQGLSVSANGTGAKGIAGTGFGTLDLSNVDVSSTGGPALDLTNGTLNGTVNGLSSSNSATTGVNLNGVGGTLTAAGGSISGATGTAFNVTGGNVNVRYGGSITSGSAPLSALLSVSAGHTGTLAFEGALSATNGTGLQFDDADGTYNFNAPTSTTSLNGGDAGIDILHGSGGTFAFGRSEAPADFAVTNPSGSALVVNASRPNITYNGNLTKSGTSAGLLVDITNQASGTVTFQNGTLSSSSTTGTGLNFSNADGTVNLNGMTTLNGGDAGIDVIAGSSGTIKIADGTGSASITNPTNEAVRIDASTPTFSYGGSINKTNGSTGITVSSNTGGTIDFKGTTKTITSSGSAAVNLTSNTGTTIRFINGGLAVTTTTGSGLNAKGGGTLSVEGPNNTLSSVGGTALYVQDTTIGVGGLSFKSISANGGSNGILLDNTGATAGLSVAGDGATAGSGGTIQNAGGADGAVSGNGVYLNRTSNVSLKWMNFTGSQNNGVYGTGVRGFTLDQARFTGNTGTSNSGLYNESDVQLVDVGGAVSLTNSQLDGAAMNAVRIENITGTAPTINPLTITNNKVFTMQGSTSDVRGTALLVTLMDGTANAQISNNDVRVWWGNAIHVLMQGSASGTARISNNFADNTNGALAGAGGIWVAGCNFAYNISGNTVRRTNGTAISADKANCAGATFQGTIDANTIGQSGVANSGSGTGIGIFASGRNGTSTVRISNNVLRQINGSASGAITLQTGDNVAFSPSGTLNATVIGNNIQESGTTVNNAQHGILITHGATSSGAGDSHQGCFDVLNNTIVNFTSGTANNRIRVNQRFSTTSRWPGYTGTATGSTSTTDLGNYLLSRNTASTATNANLSTGGFLNTTPPGSACPQPSM